MSETRYYTWMEATVYKVVDNGTKAPVRFMMLSPSNGGWHSSITRNSDFGSFESWDRESDARRLSDVEVVKLIMGIPDE